MIRLEPASNTPPLGLAELLTELNDGENVFGGTPVPSGQMTLQAYLHQCVEGSDVKNLPPGFVPQTIFWVINDMGQAIGMVRMRHFLNKKLKHMGGHIGYYIARQERGKGYAQEALRLALRELKKIGERKAMLTVDMDNVPSIKVIETNGGKLESIGQEDDGKAFGRYWITLEGA
jgi:predicted acetyltransferase